MTPAAGQGLVGEVTNVGREGDRWLQHNVTFGQGLTSRGACGRRKRKWVDTILEIKPNPNWGQRIHNISNYMGRLIIDRVTRIHNTLT